MGVTEELFDQLVEKYSTGGPENQRKLADSLVRPLELALDVHPGEADNILILRRTLKAARALREQGEEELLAHLQDYLSRAEAMIQAAEDADSYFEEFLMSSNRKTEGPYQTLREAFRLAFALGRHQPAPPRTALQEEEPATAWDRLLGEGLLGH